MQFYCLGTSTHTSRLRAALVAFHSALPHASDYETNVNKLAKKQPHAAGYYSVVSSFYSRLTTICIYPHPSNTNAMISHYKGATYTRQHNCHGNTTVIFTPIIFYALTSGRLQNSALNMH